MVENRPGNFTHYFDKESMNKILASAVLIGVFGLAGCATTGIDMATKASDTSKHKDASPKEERETVTGSRLPRRES